MSRVKHSKQLNRKFMFCESCKKKDLLTKLLKLVSKYVKDLELLHKE